MERQQQDDGIAAIAERWGDMVLEDEEDGVDAGGAYEPAPGDGGGVVYSVVGHFLTKKLIKVEYMRQVLASVWQPVFGMRVTELHSNLFLFAFYHETDMVRVLEEGPWSFDNHTLVCRRVPAGYLPGEVKLDTLDMWIQVYDLPLGYTSNVVLEQVGNFVGTFIHCDDRRVGGPVKTFYRVRVAVPVDKPLKRRMKLIRRDKTWGWVNLKYERLHNFCFYYGILGHLEKFCAKARVSGVNREHYPYGDWMRAGQTRGPRQVGAAWLLPPVEAVPPQPNRLPTVVEGAASSDDSQGDVRMMGAQCEPEEGVEASSKRRRATTNVDTDELSRPSDMGEDSGLKNFFMAGLGSQTRPIQ
ncbi:PREDICTED: uncharacterized protein LOC109146514 [Ipomoea nil]|uniref:uncharacterized protein LOC109146514 n=1 Tax=Ipomoea nil TaxID=35883 RepID=UPI000900BF3C|nr:PREDICTED: uncharacterized protein LOC109146514 [Ipomoea nil]